LNWPGVWEKPTWEIEQMVELRAIALEEHLEKAEELRRELRQVESEIRSEIGRGLSRLKVQKGAK
jgi:hypothetical protein